MRCRMSLFRCRCNRNKIVLKVDTDSMRALASSAKPVSQKINYTSQFLSMTLRISFMNETFQNMRSFVSENSRRGNGNFVRITRRFGLMIRMSDCRIQYDFFRYITERSHCLCRRWTSIVRDALKNRTDYWMVVERCESVRATSSTPRPSICLNEAEFHSAWPETVAHVAGIASPTP